MKISFASLRPLLAVSLLGVPSTHAAVPEEPLFGATSTATLALTLTTAGPGTVAKDMYGKVLPKSNPASGPSYANNWVVVKNNKPVEQVAEVVSKQVLTKYSNKELLLDLVAFGVIDDIKGWSVIKVQVTKTNSGGMFPASAGPMHLYITHKIKAPICLTPYIKLYAEINETSVTYNYKSVMKLGDQGAPVSRTDTYASGYKTTGYCHLRFTKTVSGDEGQEEHSKRFRISALYSGSEKLVLFGANKIPVIVPAAAKMGSAIGTHAYSVIYEDDDDFTGGYIEGSISFGAGAAKEVTAYPEAAESVGSFPD